VRVQTYFKLSMTVVLPLDSKARISPVHSRVRQFLLHIMNACVRTKMDTRQSGLVSCSRIMLLISIPDWSAVNISRLHGTGSN
jgi:hypothetical protein